MRLIALAQGSSLTGATGEGPGQVPATNLSMSSLEASRYSPLPPPRMAGVPTAAGTVPTEARPSVSVAPSSPAAAPAAAVAAGEGGVGASGATAMNAAATLRGGAPDVFSALGGGGSGGVGVGGVGIGHLAGVGSAPLSFGSSPVASSAGGLQQPRFTGALPTVTPTVPSSALAGGGLVGEYGQGLRGSVGRQEERQGGGEEEEEDFGDFAGAQGGVGAERDPPPPQPSVEDDDDGFGDFSSAPSGGEAEAAASAATLPAASAATIISGGAEGKSPKSTVPADPWFGSAAAPAVSGGGAGGSGGVGVGDDDAWMMGSGEGRVTAPAGGGRSKDGLDSLIKSNLQAATSGPVHLADMVGRFFIFDLVHTGCGVYSSPCKSTNVANVFVFSAVFVVGVMACLIRGDSKVFPTLWDNDGTRFTLRLLGGQRASALRSILSTSDGLQQYCEHP